MTLRMHAVSSVSGFLTIFAIVVDSLVLVVLLQKIQVLIWRAYLGSVTFHAALDGRYQLFCDELRLSLVYLAVAQLLVLLRWSVMLFLAGHVLGQPFVAFASRKFR